MRTLLFGCKVMQQRENYESLTLEEVECDLELVGMTGVEDLLQENVS